MLVQTEPCGCRLEWADEPVGFVGRWVIAAGCLRYRRFPGEMIGETIPVHPRPSWAHHPLPWAAVPAARVK